MISASLLLLFCIVADSHFFGRREPKQLECGDNFLVSYGKNGLLKRFPWSVLLRVETVKGDRFCEGIIISPDRIFIYRCPSFYLYSPVYIFFRRRKIAEKLLFKLKKLPSKIIKNPTWTHLSGDFYYLTLDKPLKSSSRHTPICISNYIPKENISKPVYFNWDEKLYQITGNSIWGKLHYTRISKKNLRSAGVSYLKDDKWYLAGINRINSHGKNEYYSLDGRIPLSCMKKKDEICKELK